MPLVAEDYREMNPGERVYGPDVYLPDLLGAQIQFVRPDFVGMTVRQIKKLWPVQWIGRDEPEPESIPQATETFD
jgi:hypothetical protein